jgi:hypothetical protein
MFFMSLLLSALLAASAGAVYYPPGDLDEGRDVDFDDLRLFSARWLDPNCVDSGCAADLNGQGGINGTDFAILTRNWGGIAVITEFMASNHSNEPLAPGEILDEDGDSSDWIEIFNPTDTTVNLAGWYLTHDRDELTEWRFPAVVLGPGEFMIIFASEKNRRDLDKPLHTNFRLNDAGDYLALVRPDGRTSVSEYAPEYPRQLSDISYGLAQYAEVLVASQAEVSYYVPTAWDAQADWTSVEFDDSGWDTATTGLGFAQVQTEVIDVTTPGDVVQGVPNDGDWPGNEAPPLAIDNDITKKYLHFKGDFDPGDPPGGAGFQVTPSIGPSIVTGLTFTTANDAPERDPTAFALYGSNTSINGPYTLIATGSIVDFDQASSWPRHTKNSTPIRFANNKAYYHYQLMFPAIRDARSSVAMQIGEVELMGSPAGSAVSNIEELMLNTNASLWMRAQFQADEVEFFSTMTLRAKYEDGFVAYLNGSEIARQNFTGPLSWNSTADSNRPGQESEEFVSIDVSDHLEALREGTNILAIQALNDSKDDGEFLILPELTVAGEVSVAQYFTTATPGQYNTSGSLDLVVDTKFSRDRGFYDTPFSLTITTETEGGTIHYTTDGSTPSETHGNEYVGPIDISTTTCVRAIAFKPQWMSTNVDTHTYIFLDDVVNQPADPPGFPSLWNSTSADYEMDPDIVNDPAYQGLMRDSLLSIPTMSIVTDVDKLFGGSGIYSNSTLGGVAWERKASVEWIRPDNTTGFQVNAGLRIYGGDPFRGMGLTRKKSFRLLFKRIHGPTKLNFEMFDAPDAVSRFDTIVLRAGANDAWNNWSAGSNAQYILDEYMRRTQTAMGQVSPHGTFVHLYINGLYWGLYNPVERPMASFCASYYGGDKEDWDALNSGTPTGESKTATWSEMMSQASAGLSSNTAFQKIQGNNTNGTPNPAYDDLLDMDSYIDWLFSNFWGGTADWPYHNFYAGCHRPPNATGFKFFNWDAEYVMVIGSGLNSNVTGVSDNGARPYVTLRQNAEFKMQFADHVQRHLFDNGPATYGPSYDRYKELADEIELAIIAESARWGDMARSTPYTVEDWRRTRDHILNTYMPQRPAIVLEQMKGAGLYPDLGAPVFHVNGGYRHGGQILATDEVSMLVPDNIVYIHTELVSEGAAVHIHVPSDDSLGLSWTSRTFTPDSAWQYSDPGTGVGYERGSGYEGWINTDIFDRVFGTHTSVFIIIEFNLDSIEDFDKLALEMIYDDAFIAYLNGVEVYRTRNITNDIPGQAAANYLPVDPADFEEFDITAYMDELVVGRNVLAIHGINSSTGSSDMLILPKLLGGIIDESSNTDLVLYTTDGSDPRLQYGLTNPNALEYTGPIMLTESRNIKARVLRLGKWSAVNEATFAVGPVAENLRITELMFHPRETGDPNNPNEEFVELKNIGAEAINLNLVRFTNGIDFTFGDIELPPGALVVIVRDRAAFDARYPAFSGIIAGQYSGSLNNGRPLQSRPE